MSSDLGIISRLAITRASLPQVLTYTGSSNTSLPGNLAIAGSLAVTGSLSVTGVSTSGVGSSGTVTSTPDNVFGSLLMRVFDDSAVYAGQTLTAGSALPPPFLTRPLMDVPTGSVTLTQAVFGSATSYSARLAGYVCPPTTGTYLWRTTYRDGATMYIGTQKMVDSWTYTGSVTQAVGTLSMTQGVWTDIVLEHAASSTLTERLLVEFSTNSGTVYSTLAHGTASGQFQLAYNIREVPSAMLGTSYASGRTYFADTAVFNSALVLSNTTGFTGRTSELYNDAGYALSGTASAITCLSLTASAVVASTANFSGTLTLGNRIAAKLPQVQVQQVFGPFTGGTNTSFVFLGGTQLWQVSANVYCTSSASGKTTFTLLVDGATPTGSGSNIVYFYGNNTCSSDLSYPVMMFTTTLAAGTHTVQMNSTGSGYTSDSNKMANLAVTEYPT